MTRVKAVRCADWWERGWKGHRSVAARGQCKRLTAHPSGYCKTHRYQYRWSDAQEAEWKRGLKALGVSR